MTDPIRAADFNTLTLRLSLRAGEPLRVARALLLEAAFVASRGHAARRCAFSILDRVTPVAEEVADPALDGWVLGTTAFVHYQMGEFVDARACADKSRELLLSRTTGTAWERNSVDVYALWSSFYLGDLGRIADSVPQLIIEARRRGDLFAAANLQTGLPNLTWLVRGQPEEARRRAKHAMSFWSRERFLLQHAWGVFAAAQCDLYQGRGCAAYDAIVETWPALKRSLLLRNQILRVEFLHLRAHAALAAAASERDKEPLLRVAERDAKQVASERISIGPPLGALLRAGLATIRGDLERAVASLDDADQSCEASHLEFFLQVARRRRGKVLGGEEGAQLVADADEWMRRNSIADPERMTALYDPSAD